MQSITFYLPYNFKLISFSTFYKTVRLCKEYGNLYKKTIFIRHEIKINKTKDQVEITLYLIFPIPKENLAKDAELSINRAFAVGEACGNYVDYLSRAITFTDNQGNIEGFKKSSKNKEIWFPKKGEWVCLKVK